MITYKWITALIAIAIVAKILFLIRRDALHVRYSIWWLVVAGMILASGLFPRLVDIIGSKVGVSYPPILAVAVALGLIFVKMLTMDLDRSVQERKIRRLTQRLAMLESENSDLAARGATGSADAQNQKE